MLIRVGLPAGWFNNLPGKMTESLRDRIFNITGEEEFWETTLKVFNYQYENNPVYREFIKVLGRDQSSFSSQSEIPFLPVEFFRNHKIISGGQPAEIIFESSGTTGTTPGRHYVADLRLYEKSFLKSFQLFYGEPADYLIIALLPAYSEREGSSLVYMADKLINESHDPLSGFYKENKTGILKVIKEGKARGERIILLGVSFALLDLAESGPADLSGIIVMETGGMKGRRKELTRTELHYILKKNLNLKSVHSEYGMTELMSQAYSKGEGIFYAPPWMKIILRDPQDPLSLFNQPGKTGGINIIDLANLHSCSFLATGDLGKLHEDGGFEVLGRFDSSDIRGCNLMAD
jgi:phenylacetate-coenzyme A ligase PaaK-like adenylate-forming protein